MSARPALALASGSAIRARILEGAGLDFSVLKPGVDEAAIKRAMTGVEAETVALALAEAKAKAVAVAHDGVIVAADQMLRFDGALFDKAEDMAEARARLAAMRGRTHELVNGMVVMHGGEIVARHSEVSRLSMRAFSDAFLDGYLAQAGPGVLASVGCYQFEGLGAQLFERVEGDFFAVLGLPLLPLLAILRAEGALEA